MLWYTLIDAGSGDWLLLNLISHYTALGFVVSTFFLTVLHGTLDLCPVASETEDPIRGPKQALSPKPFVPYLKISQDTKLPETSFLSVLTLLHILPCVALLLQVAFVDQSGVFQPGAWVAPTQMV